MEEDLSLSLELGGSFTKRKGETFSVEEMIDNQGKAKKTKQEKNTEERLFMNLNLSSVQYEMINKLTESSQEVNNKATPANSASSQHSMASSLQEQLSIKNKTKENQANKADSQVATISDIDAMNEEENTHSRKKLRLSKYQAMLLEEHFREHPTLNPKLKLDLAKQLSLQPRQVEVWFQNRRARTKLKQTEIDCKYLKHRYQMLSQENCQLKREVAELRALKMAYPTHPFYKNLAPTSGLPFCPSCQHNSTYFSDATNCKPAMFASLLSKPRL